MEGVVYALAASLLIAGSAYCQEKTRATSLEFRVYLEANLVHLLPAVPRASSKKYTKENRQIETTAAGLIDKPNLRFDASVSACIRCSANPVAPPLSL